MCDFKEFSPHDYWNEEIDPRFGERPLLICCFLTGLIDAASYSYWAVFLAMQTGNTVFLGISTTTERNWQKSLLAIGSYLVGSMLTSHLSRHFGQLRRRTLFISFLLQAVSILAVAVFLQTAFIPSFDVNSPRILIAIPFMSWQFGAQLVTSRCFGFLEIPTNMLSVAYSELASDPALFVHDNRKRDRRIVSVLAILGGAIVSSWLSKTPGGIAVIFWIAGGIKTFLTINWLLPMK